MASTSTPMLSYSFHNTHSTTYERLAGGCTRRVAEYIVTSTLPRTLPITSQSRILDNACGTGLVTAAIQASHGFGFSTAPASITAADLAPAMTEQVKALAAAKGWENVKTEVLDVRSLKGLDTESFSHAVTSFGIVAMGSADLEGPVKACKELFRVLQKGGISVVTIWKGMSSVSFFGLFALVQSWLFSARGS